MADEFDAFTTLKALREMKKQLDAKSQVDQKQKPVLQYLQKQQLSIYELRIQVQSQLARLADLSTRQAAFQNLFQIIQQNQSQSSLQLLISCLQTPSYEKGDGIVKTVTMIVGVYQLNITVQDVYKLLEIVLKHFNDPTVQQACSECWSAIYINNVYKRQLQQRTLLLYTTLSGILTTGSSRQGQETAALVMSQLFETLNTQKDVAFLKEVLRDFLAIYLKSQIDHPGLHNAMQFLLVQITIQNFNNQQQAVIDKALLTVNSKLNYRTRIGACSLLKLIGVQYQNSNFRVLLGNLYEQVIVVLDEQTRDRIIAVQNSARMALKEWMKLKMQVDTQQEIEKSNLEIQTSALFQKKKTGTGGGQVNGLKKMVNPNIVNVKQQLDSLVESQLDQTQDFNHIADHKNAWDKAQHLDALGMVQEAVELLMLNGDDLYLLRFLLQQRDYKKFFDCLDQQTASHLIDALLMILESDFLNIMCLDFVQGYFDNGLKEWFQEPDFREYLQSQHEGTSGMQSQSILKQL